MRSPIAAESPTRSRMLATRRSISPRENVPWAASGSATMSLMRRRGLSEANGSWNTGWISRARALRSRSNRRLPSTSTVARRRLEQPEDQARQRGFAAAGLADDAEHAAGRHAEGDVVDRDHALFRPTSSRCARGIRTAGSRPRSRRSCGLRLRQSRREPAEIVVRVARRPARNLARAGLVGMGAARAEGAAGKARRRSPAPRRGSSRAACRAAPCPAPARRTAGRAYRDAAARANSSAVGARSTTSPAYITDTRSATRATMPRSWVISRIDEAELALERRRAAAGSAPAR